MEEGLVQVYTGEGKGKTTAALGLVARALGRGFRVLLVRFLKPVEPASGEVLFLQGSPGLEILTSGIGIIHGSAEREGVAESVLKTWAEARLRVESEDYDLVIFDEINNVLHRGYLPISEALEFIEAKPSGTELVLTGRNAPTEVLEAAHLVTRMEAVRHPMKDGIPARPGIEY